METCLHLESADQKSNFASKSYIGGQMLILFIVTQGNKILWT